MRIFFQDKIVFEYHATRALILVMEEQEEQLSDFSKKSMSHILNVHHIWNARLKGNVAESNDWDLLPVDYWTKFNQQNYNETKDVADFLLGEEVIHYTTSEGVKSEMTLADIMYHLLTHQVYHRAQIIYDMKLNNLRIPEASFIGDR